MRNGTGKDPKYSIKEGGCSCSSSKAVRDPYFRPGSRQILTLCGELCRVVAQWWSNFSMASTFCVRPHSLTKGRGEVRGGVGSPHLRLSWPMFWLVSGWFGLFLQFLASVRVRICICWVSMDGWWVLMALGGVSRLFSFLDLGWCEGMVDSDEERSV